MADVSSPSPYAPFSAVSEASEGKGKKKSLVARDESTSTAHTNKLSLLG